MCCLACACLWPVPHGLEEKAYKSGKWLEFVKLEKIASVVSAAL